MTRPRLSSPDQPAWLRVLVRLCEAMGSLKLAVVLIVGSAVLLGGATFVEKFFGAPAARDLIYGAWWFVAVNAVLFLNVLCAALFRFPWRRGQIGFLVTHGGILLLLAGCLATRLGGIEAELPVYEEETARTAYLPSRHLELQVYRDSNRPEAANTISVPFDPGPFNWSDYGRWYLSPWRLAHRDRGVLYDSDGIRLEAIDYCRDSDLMPAPPLVLQFCERPSQTPVGSEPSPDQWETVGLWAPALPELRGLYEGMDATSWRKLTDNLHAVFWVAWSLAETEAFRDSAPGKDEPFGSKGRVILYAGRLAQEKRVLALLDALRPLLQANEHCKVLLAGAGPAATQLAAAARAWGLDRQVLLAGPFPWELMPQIYTLAQVFATASLSEIHPMTVIEALMCGLPIVARRDASFVDLVRSGYNGFLADSDAEIAPRVAALLQDAALRHDFAEHARALSAQFTVEAHVDRLEKLYRQVIDHHRA